MFVKRTEANHILDFNVPYVDRQLNLHIYGVSAQMSSLSNSIKHDLDFQIFAAPTYT